MVSEILFGVATVAGAGLCWLGYESYRRWDDPGSSTFAAFLGIWGTTPFVALAATPGGETTVSITQVLLYCLATVPWFLFALQYTGRYTRFRFRTAVALAIPSLALVPWLLSEENTAVVELFGTLVLSYYSTLAFVGAVLVVVVTRKYGHLSLVQGVLLAIAGILPFLTMTTFGILAGEAADVVTTTIYTAGFVGTALASGLALFRYDIFESTPAAGTIGQRAIARETDDMILIVDDDSRIIKCNDAAVTNLEQSRAEMLGESLSAVLDATLAAFERETVELGTERGVRKFDPQVTALTDQHGNRLGSMLSLRDVTDREIRKQRLEVLNRIVTHNLRNEISVIKANTEVVAAELEDATLREHLTTATDSADSLQSLGGKAKRIEELFGRNHTTDVDIAALVESVASDAEDEWPAAAVVFDTPDVTVEGDQGLLRFVVENLVENGIEHNDGEPEVEVSVGVGDGEYPVTITVADDGPGIPDQELEVLREETESQLKHGSGVGLWVTNWAVTDIGGELSFEEREPRGTLARVRLPYDPLQGDGTTDEAQ